jgi:hypothetical protein
MIHAFRVLCLCVLLAGCLPTGPSDWDELRRSQERWQARQPTTYAFVFQRSCGECLPEATVPLLITVHERQIRSVVNQQTGEPVSAEVYQPKRIEDLFAIVEAVLEQGAYRMSVSYDRNLGYPTSIFINYDRQMVDDEIGYSARELHAVD